MNKTKIALAEDDQRSHKEKIKADSKEAIDHIQILLEQLKENFGNEHKFNEILRVIHGRFSKIEINLNDLEKLKNVGI